jgi:hypothetical protein
MTIEQLGSLGEFIAAIATVATLAYLAIQIRLNAKSARGAIAQGVIESEIAAAALIVQNADVYRRGNASFSELNDTEKTVYTELVFIEITQMWNAFTQHQSGLMNDTVFAAFNTAWGNHTEKPGFQSVYAKIRDEFPEDFCLHFDKIAGAQ